MKLQHFFPFALFASTMIGCASDATSLRKEPVGVQERNARAKAELAELKEGGETTPFKPSESGVKEKPDESEVEKTVRARAQQRWELLVQERYDEAYGLLSPNSRLSQTKEIYKSQIRPGFWKAARIVRVDCATQNRCVVNSLVTARVMIGRIGAMENASPVEETWVFVDNQWWYVPPTR